MAYQAKTKAEDLGVQEYILTLEPARRREDALKMLRIFEEETGWPAVLWTGGMIGFGRYDYTYESGHSGTALRVGYAPRKGKISIYTWLDEEQRADMLPRLGKHSTGVGCIYANKLADIDESVLREMICAAVHNMAAWYPDPGEK